MNGLNLYYEIQGSGEPLILLHGTLGAKSDVMGYSLGGGLAVRTAVRHPELLRKLVLVATAFKRDG